MSEKLQPVKGTKDLLPTDFALHQHIIDTAKSIVKKYGYQDMATPILEYSELFKRSLGDSSDIVGKEMYSFLDKGDRELTLRPEFTAAICRAFITHGLHHQLPVKYFSHGPLFRYEKPQKGRQRQFHQVNCEFIGNKTPFADIELIAMACQFLNELKISDLVKLEINSLGCTESRLNYRDALIEYFSKFENELSTDSKLRLKNNPLRILDSKDENDRIIIKNAPLIDQYFTENARMYFDQVLAGLDALNIKYEVNPKLVRGLDYYSHTAFEFTTTHLGAQGTVLAGGRYDSLISSLGGPETSAIGFGSGIERLALLIENVYKPQVARPIAIINIGDELKIQGLKIAQELRFNGFNVQFDSHLNNVAKRMKLANENNASAILFLGETEIQNNMVKLKDLDSGNEQEISLNNLKTHLENYRNIYA